LLPESCLGNLTQHYNFGQSTQHIFIKKGYMFRLQKASHHQAWTTSTRYNKGLFTAVIS